MIDEAQLARALAEHRDTGRRLGNILLDLDLVDEETLVRTVARQLSVSVVWLRRKRIRSELLALLPREFIEKHRCLPVLIDERENRTLIVAMEDPSDRWTVEEASRRVRLAVRTVIAAPSELDEAIERHFALGAMPMPRDEWDNGLCQPDLLRVSAQGTAPRSAPLPPLPPLGLEEPNVPNASFNERVLRALAQLLVEKGVLSREELVARLDECGADDGAADSETT